VPIFAGDFPSRDDSVDGSTAGRQYGRGSSIKMPSINDIVSSTAASNPLVGGIVASAAVQAGILSTVNGASTSTSTGLTSLIAAANSAAALSPAATYTPSSDLAAALTAASSTSTLPFVIPIVQATQQAGTESSLLDSLGSGFNGMA